MRSENGCILLLEKEIDLRRTLALVLKRAGYAVLSPSNEMEASEMVTRVQRSGGRIALVVMGDIGRATTSPELARKLTKLGGDVQMLLLANGTNGRKSVSWSVTRKKAKAASMRIPYTAEDFIKCVEELMLPLLSAAETDQRG